MQGRGLALLVYRQVAHLRGELARQGLHLATQIRLQLLQLLDSDAARRHPVFQFRQFQRDARLHGLPHGLDDLAELGRQGLLQRGKLPVYSGNLLGAGLLSLRHIAAKMCFYLLNGLFNRARMGGRVRIHSLQIQSDLGVDFSQAPVHVPDVLSQTGLQGNYYLFKHASVQAIAELQRRVLVDRLCMVFHISQPFRQGTKLCHFILPRLGGSLREFHRHAEQETIA